MKEGWNVFPYIVNRGVEIMAVGRGVGKINNPKIF